MRTPAEDNMRKLAAGALAGLVVLGALAAVASVAVSRPLFDERLEADAGTLVIAPPGTALSFARFRAGGTMRVLLAVDARDGKLMGIDLNARLGTKVADPLALYREHGYGALSEQASSIANMVVVDLASLETPFDGHEHNIGVGLNYREHAQESELDEEPFLFPKLARPTPAVSEVSRRDSLLLDYEAELGLVALEDLAPGAAPATLGLVLANELTDRWALVRGLDRAAPMGATGFADGKGREGFAPLGPLLVIPRDLAAFYPQLELRLYLNGRLRQKERAAAMLWTPQRILAEIFWRADWRFEHRGGQVPLLPPGGLRAGTIIFSGTPAGVIFKPLNLWNPWVYLRPGDEVVLRADHLGSIRNRIVP
jgi:2,4-didehydro-3-deoxy-L-rhamnonate hydrolase